MSRTEKVKYYSNNDWSIGHSLKRSVQVLQEFDETRKYDSNEILEFYNIILMVKKNKVYPKSWDQTQTDKYVAICSAMEKYIAKEFVKLITDDNFKSLYNSIDYKYREDIFDIIDKYKVYEKLKFETLSNLFNVEGGIPKYMLLKRKSIVLHLDKELSNCLIDDFMSAEILLNKYVVKKDCGRKEIFIPTSLTYEQKEKIVNDYIASDRANPNYIDAIINMKNTKEFGISKKTVLAAKKKREHYTDNFFNNNVGFEYGCEVGFAKDQTESVIYESYTPIVKVKYSVDWIKDNLDQATLLNNFIYLFEYCDNQMRLGVVSKTSQLGLTEKHFGIKGKDEYEYGVTFNIMNILSHLQIQGYHNLLKEFEVRLEEVIEWFFRTYLLDEFKIENYIIDMPSENSTYLEKCRSVSAEIESILTGYYLYVENGEIEPELLEMTPTPLFKDMKSLNNKKYIYAKSDLYYRLAYLFFSDQCMLNYCGKTKKKEYDNFYLLLLSEKIKVEDVVEFEKDNVQFLLDNNYLVQDEEGFLKILDKEMIHIVKDLYKNEVINYLKKPLPIRNRIDELLADETLCEDNTLFTKLENDYFNFYLNNSEFGNALALRNKYLHGKKIGNDANGDVHKYNYFILLRIVVLILIKINDDLSINSP